MKQLNSMRSATWRDLAAISCCFAAIICMGVLAWDIAACTTLVGESFRPQAPAPRVGETKCVPSTRDARPHQRARASWGQPRATFALADEGLSMAPSPRMRRNTCKMFHHRPTWAICTESESITVPHTSAEISFDVSMSYM